MIRTKNKNQVASNILKTVGETPIIQLNKLFAENHFTVFGKSEFANPSGSIKDRTAWQILNSALIEGLINKNSTIIESSSGNMALGLAQACLYLGLKLIVVVDPKINSHTEKLLKAFQVTLVKVNQEEKNGGFLAARLNKVQELLKNTPNSYWTNQYGNPYNPKAHHKTMEEVFEALNAKVDYLFIATSTCGTLMGCAEYIHEHHLPTKIIAVDAKGSVLFGGKPGKRLVPGHGAGVPSQFLELSKITDHTEVTDLDCIKGCWTLLQQEAILCGGSTGGVIEAIHNYSPYITEGSNCVMMLCDRGDRYLDTIYNKEWILENIEEAQDLDFINE
jgi:cysteine synthase A